MSRINRVMQLLGLARRAGGVAIGTEAVRQAVRGGEARLVLLAGDASPVQLEKVEKAMSRRPTPRASLSDRATLGAAVGRAPVSAVALTSASLAEQISAELGDLLVSDSVAVGG